MNAPTTVVIGAGPYGLSVAAHLRGAGIPTATFGKPMDFWLGMPSGMYLRSAWSASNLSAPDHGYDLDSFLSATGRPRQQPIPLRLFNDYGLWFARQAVPDVDRTMVRSLSKPNGHFRIELEDGRCLDAARVVVATGIDRFARMPAFARDLPPSLASHTRQHHDFGVFKGKRVAVVGGGQSAIECSALLYEAGAHVELIVRRTVRWLKLHDYRGPGRRLLYAPSDVGPPGLNWLLHFPLAFRLLPRRLQLAVTRRAVRPAGARWLIDRVQGRVRITSNAQVLAAKPVGGGVQLELSDGSTRTVDHVLLATGYQPDIERLEFIDPELRRQIRHRDGFPVLSRWLESSVDGLHFVGGLADRSYGPICRFVSGADVAARRITAYARRRPRR
jgi:cation diffusion facilitator CzcD-associated flavoprotein CzcO